METNRMIESTRNPLVLRFKSLQRAKGRREERLFLAEGRKVIEEAWRAGLSPEAVLYAPRALAPASDEQALLALLPQNVLYQVSEAVLKAATDTVSPQPLAAVFPLPEAPTMEEQTGFCLVMDRIQDPGNLGSMLRSGDALGADWLLLGPGCADPYAPKTLRAAMGSTFHLPLVQAENLPTAMDGLAGEGYAFLAGDLRGQDGLPSSLPMRTGLVVGNEGNGISEDVLRCCRIRYRLPMKGRAESLNASAFAAILLHEISQRLPKRNGEM